MKDALTHKQSCEYCGGSGVRRLGNPGMLEWRINWDAASLRWHIAPLNNSGGMCIAESLEITTKSRSGGEIGTLYAKGELLAEGGTFHPNGKIVNAKSATIRELRVFDQRIAIPVATMTAKTCAPGSKR